MESELFLAILSSMAESESVSISANSKWSIQKRFENGTYKVSYPPYGYDWDGEQMVINAEQAAVVKEIFAALLSGKGTHAIADDLNQRGIPTKRNGHWTATTIRGMLSNEKYVGDCFFQKTYSDSRFVRHNNHGEQTQYLVKDHHEAIISREDFEAAQTFIHQRATEKGVVKGSDKYQNRYTFSGKIICGECGNTFKRRIHHCTGYKYAAWCCNTHIKDKDKCHMLFIKDDDLKQAFITMMNKLVYVHRIILKPYVDALKNTSSDDSLRRIQEIQTLLAHNTEKRETLTKLMTQSHHQLQSIGHSTFGKGKSDKELYGVFGFLDFCEAAAGFHHTHDKEQHKQGKPDSLQCPVYIYNDIPYRPTFELFGGLGDERPYLG